MSLRPVAAFLLSALVLLLSGCENQKDRLPTACTAGARDIVTALSAAPRPVALEGGTRLSTCVQRAQTDAEIQTVGAVLTQAGDDLSGRMGATDRAALELGYLIGAVRRGARQTNGIHLELVRRLEQATGLDGAPGPRREAFRRGLSAGAREG